VTLIENKCLSKANLSLKYACFSSIFNSAFKADTMNSKWKIKIAKCSAIRNLYHCVLAQMQCHRRHGPVSFAKNCSAMGDPYRYVYAYNVVQQEAQTGVFRLKL